ncbi:conserved hypothetical protein [Burkholderia cenocepacia PC184]|nr:conserved hypothetical protein [Burkholderia cenocepacia PC184]
MPLHRRAAQQRIRLRARITEFLQILDGVQTRLAIRGGDVEIMLAALLVDGNALENEVVVIGRRDRAGLKDGVADTVFRHAALDEVHAHMHPAGHFDRAAERDLAVALAEVQVADRQARAIHVHGEKHLRAARQILDVAIAAMLARRHRARALRGGLVARVARELAHVRGGRERRIRERRHALGRGGDQAGFARVPGFQQSRIGQAADQAGVNQAREIHARNMARARVDTMKIPDRFLRAGEMIGEKAAAVRLRKEAVEAPLAVGLRADVEQVDHQQVAGLRAVHAHRAGQEVHDRQVDVAHVVGAVVVLDEAAGPVVGFEDEIVAGLDPAGHRNVGVPAIVHLFVFVGRLVQIDLDESLGHDVRSLGSRIDRRRGARTPRRAQTDRYSRMRSVSPASRVLWCTKRPPSITNRRSATSSAKLSTCSDTTMAILRLVRIWLSALAMSLMTDGWMPSVGSSSSSTFGSVASARAIASCCCWPPDRLPPLRFLMSNSTGNNA